MIDRKNHAKNGSEGGSFSPQARNTVKSVHSGFFFAGRQPLRRRRRKKNKMKMKMKKKTKQKQEEEGEEEEEEEEKANQNTNLKP